MLKQQLHMLCTLNLRVFGGDFTKLIIKCSSMKEFLLLAVSTILLQHIKIRPNFHLSFFKKSCISWEKWMKLAGTFIT